MVDGAMQLRHAITAAVLLAIPALSAADSGWITVTPDNAGFSVEFPVTPSYQPQQQEGLTTHIWQANTVDENVLVLVGVTDYWQHIDTDEELRLDEKNILGAIGGTASASTRET